MLMNNRQLLELKGKIKSLDELKSICDSHNISYTPEELEETYNFLKVSESELDFNDLNDVSGGTANQGPYHVKCHNCHTKIQIPAGGYAHTKCPNCGADNTLDNCYRGLC